MKQYIIYIIFIGCLLIQPIDIKGSEARRLSILLDWKSEQVELGIAKNGKIDLGPVIIDLIATLQQKAAPIFVSVATLQNFLICRNLFTDFVHKDSSYLVKTYLGKMGFNSVEKINTLQQYYKDISHKTVVNIPLTPTESDQIACYLVHFLKEDWHILYINEFFYLLIPKRYEEHQLFKFLKPILIDHYTQTKNLAMVEKLKTIPFFPWEISEILRDNESLVRLHWQTATGFTHNSLVENIYDITNRSLPSTIDFDKAFNDALSKIFVTKRTIDEYAHLEWYIYAAGHASGNTIMPLSISTFKSFLYFLNNKINTKFLLYNSCFIGGKHLHTPFVYKWNIPTKGIAPQKVFIPEVFNYSIAATTIFYKETYAYPLQVADKKLDFFQNFNNFFKLITDYFEKPNSKITLAKIIDYAAPFLDEQSDKVIIAEVPAIRFPYTEWFSLLNVDNQLFRITRILAQTRETENKPIIITDKIKIIVENFLPDKNNKNKFHGEIMTPLIIHGDFPQSISAAPGPADHYFNEIKTDTGFQKVVQSFIQSEEGFYHRKFYLKKLICSDDLNQQYKEKMGVENNNPLVIESLLITVNSTHPLLSESEDLWNEVWFKYGPESKVFYLGGIKSEREQLIKKSSLTVPLIEFPSCYSYFDYPYRLPIKKYEPLTQLLKKQLQKE